MTQPFCFAPTARDLILHILQLPTFSPYGALKTIYSLCLLGLFSLFCLFSLFSSMLGLYAVNLLNTKTHQLINLSTYKPISL